MFHFQVVSMGTRLLLLCVIYQTVITEPLGGVTLPVTDVIGKVTPVKPKASSVSTASSSDISSSSLVCDSKDIIPQLFSPVSGTRELALPLALTSSSIALPVPKIDSLSDADVIGKVTPVNPKPSSPATVSSSSISSSSLVCDSKDIRPKLFPPALGTREISLPLSVTSSSRALPEPKLDSISMADVIGKVTPVKPKPPSSLSVSSSGISSSSLVCDSKDIKPKLFPPASETQEFSLPLPLTQSFIGLPVPNIDLLSDADVVGKVTPVKPKPFFPATVSSSSISSSSLVCDSKDTKPKLYPPASGTQEFSLPLPLTQSFIALPIPNIDLLSDADVVGRVTPVKPKPSFPATVSSSSISSSPLVCDSKDLKPKLFPPASRTQEFSLPLALTSSSIGLPVPNIDSLSDADVVGKVTPVKPKPFFPATVSSSSISSSSLVCDSKDIKRKLFPQASETREISLPLSVTSSYRALPEPKLDSLSMPDVIGKVTPVKPKPSSLSSVSSSGISSSSLVCESKDIIPKLFSPASGTQEFSLPLALTSSSRALPVPKIDSLSIADVKLPEKLRENFLSSKLCNAAIRNTKPDICTPDSSLPYLSCSSNPSNALPTYSSWDMYSSSLNKISSLSNIKSLPIVPVKPLKSNDTDVLCSASKSNNVLTQPSITPLSRSRTSDSPLTLEARKSSFSEKLNSNTFSPLAFCSLPLNYNSMYLPGVRTPSNMLPSNFKPTSYKAAGNIDFSSQSRSRNLLSPKTFIGPSLPIYMNLIKTAEVPKPIHNTIQLPKTPSNIPVSIKHPLFTEKCVTNPIEYSPPIIPLEPIPTISFGSTAFSPVNYFPSQISQTPTFNSYINQSPYSIAQSTANMVSSSKDVVSNIDQNKLYSYKYNIDSAAQNIQQMPTMQSNPYDNPEFLLKQTLPVLPLPQGNPMNTISTLPSKRATIDCIKLPAVDTTTILSSDAPYKSSAFEMSSNQPLRIASPQPTSTILPSTSLTTFSSPQLCPSYLPSPFLPSYPTITSPLYMEAPAFKVNSSKKDSDLYKLIELVLLAEELNNGENSDPDDLDEILAFLSVS